MSNTYLNDILIVAGSVRKNSNSLKVAKLVNNFINRKTSLRSAVLDPRDYNLPIPGYDETDNSKQRLQDTFANSKAVVFITPEYNGTFSSIIKLIIENLGYPSKLNGKPVALGGVTAGMAGAIKPVEHLRSVLAHCKAYVIPEFLSVPDVTNLTDENLAKMIEERAHKIIRSLSMFIKNTGKNFRIFNDDLVSIN